MNRIKFSFFYLAIALFAFSCTQSPKSDEAQVGEAQEVSEVADSASTYTIDKAQSEVTWVGTKPTGRHDGTFPIKEGKLQVTNDKVVGGTIVMDLTQLAVVDREISDEDRQKLTGHLQSADFFDVENHPEAKFVITAVAPYTEESATAEAGAEADTEFQLANPTHLVTGNLTLRGETKSITFPAKINIEGDQASAQAKFNIDRTDWGVSYGDENAVADKARDKFIHNKVNLGLDIKASK